MKKYAIIVAGGKGERMGSAVPKQFLPLAGRPILMHTIEAFHQYDPNIVIIVVLPKNQVGTWKKLINDFQFDVEHTTVIGGEKRCHSVQNGLSTIDQNGLVAIHDGVRPLVSIDIIGRTFDIAEKKGNAIPVVLIKDSLRMISSGRSEAIDRNKFVYVQTPQTFQVEIIKKAYDQSCSEDLLDDASVLENYGVQIHLCEGEPANIKITTQEDLQIAESVFSSK